MGVPLAQPGAVQLLLLLLLPPILAEAGCFQGPSRSREALVQGHLRDRQQHVVVSLSLFRTYAFYGQKDVGISHTVDRRLPERQID